MRKFLFLALVGVSAGCQSAPQDVDRTAAYDREVKNYFACVLVHSDRYAKRSREDAYYVALAARDACGAERATAQKAVFASERSETRSRIWKIYDDGVVEDMTARITRKRLG